MVVRRLTVAALLAAACGVGRGGERSGALPGAAKLSWAEDDEQIASKMVAGVDRFLLHELARSPARRLASWRPALSSPAAYQAWLAGRRRRLAHMLGVRDPRIPFDALETVGSTARPARVARGPGYAVWTVRWPAFGDVTGEGLLLAPERGAPAANVVLLPDAGQAPEALAGLADGLAPDQQWARRLAERGCRVVVPWLTSRRLERRRGRALLSDREFIYRSAYELGRHVIGYEIQKVLALVDWFDRRGGEDGGSGRPSPIGVAGWGEGGMLALYCGALDPRIDAVGVQGYFDSREEIWREPIERNVFGLLEAFGDAELAAMIAPRPLVVEACRGPAWESPGEGGGPGRLATPPLERVRAEWARARRLTDGAAFAWPARLVISGPDGRGEPGSPPAWAAWVEALGLDPGAPGEGEPPERLAPNRDAERRRLRQLHELDRHNQWLLRESPYVRQELWKDVDLIFARKPGAIPLQEYARRVAPLREMFRREIIGWFDRPLAAPNPRARRAYQGAGWTGYDVVLDVFPPDVFAYGVLLLPGDLRPGERRPVVVCQHGLEGRPRDVIAGGHRAYRDFAARLAERGFVVFAPQNLYVFGDRFRTLQRKANPLGKTLFSVMGAQHEQIVRWLGSLPMVDPERIAFYGLSYGGKSAMRIPALVQGYCLSICSGDFNEWIWKNASTRCRYSYVWTGEYEMFEFNLGETFNYAEMAALIAPRPFMVERGHFDGVAPDEAVAYEFAKVRLLYQARLGLPERCRIEWFVGPHAINGKGTFAFLHEQLGWPPPASGDQ